MSAMEFVDGKFTGEAYEGDYANRSLRVIQQIVADIHAPGQATPQISHTGHVDRYIRGNSAEVDFLVNNDNLWIDVSWTTVGPSVIIEARNLRTPEMREPEFSYDLGTELVHREDEPNIEHGWDKLDEALDKCREWLIRTQPGVVKPITVRQVLGLEVS